MNKKHDSYEPRYAVKDAPRIKTVGVQIGGTDHNLEAKIKQAFGLAKSAGRELDLTFVSVPPKQRVPVQLYL